MVSAKVLVAVVSCHKYTYYDMNRGMQDWLASKRITEDRMAGLRATWLPHAPEFGFDYKVFKGRQAGYTAKQDEVILDCLDDYYNLSSKVRGIVQWAVARGYDYMFKVDDDSFVYLDRLVKSGFEQHDYVGRNDPRIEGYVPGGPGYWLSRKALDLLAASGAQPWQEDVWAGTTLARFGIEGVRDHRYFYCGGEQGASLYIDPSKLPANHDYIALTACTTATMGTLYKEWRQQIHSGGM